MMRRLRSGALLNEECANAEAFITGAIARKTSRRRYTVPLCSIFCVLAGFRFLLHPPYMESHPNQHGALRKLYPTLSDKELKEAEANLHRYFEFALRTVDTSEPDVTIKERSIVSLKNNLFEHG